MICCVDFFGLSDHVVIRILSPAGPEKVAHSKFLYVPVFDPLNPIGKLGHHKAKGGRGRRRLRVLLSPREGVEARLAPCEGVEARPHP